MAGLYDLIENALIWGAVIFAIGLVIYLAYLQHLKVKHRRARRRHREHRARRHQPTPLEGRKPNHDSPGSVQEPTNP